MIGIEQWKHRACMVSETARDHGFDDATWANLPGKLGIAITELDELVDYFTEGGDPYQEELADFAIRLLAILQNLEGDNWNFRAPRIRSHELRGLPLAPIEVVVWPIVSKVCKAIECWRKGNREDTICCLELALSETLRAAHRLGVDLVEEIDLKHRKNVARPKLNGKVESLG